MDCTNNNIEDCAKYIYSTQFTGKFGVFHYSESNFEILRYLNKIKIDPPLK